MTKKVKGYKAFNKDLTCKGFQYEIGKEYEYNGTVAICLRGFHFCKSLADCYNFYDMNEDTRICEVEAWGTVLSDKDGIKYVTDHIKVVKEVKNPREKSNLSKTSSGYCNSGDYNSGDRNSGNRNSGYCNSGDWNSGYYNSGYRNSGDYNSGYWNSGDRNSGYWNSGDWNSGDWNSGVFNTEKTPKIKMFDKDSDWTMKNWLDSEARVILQRCPCSESAFINKSNMTDEEKANHPECETIGGYVKAITVTAEDKQKWWDELSESDKNTVKALPNFDERKFCECVGIKHT